MMNKVFRVIANGKQVGITVACNQELAQSQASRAFTRTTTSKEFSIPDYEKVEVEMMDASAQDGPGLVQKLLSRIAQASNSRFIETEA